MNNNNNQNINMSEHSGAAHVLIFEIVREHFVHPNDAFEFIHQANSKIDAFINQNINRYPTKASQDAFRQQQTLLDAQAFVNSCRSFGFEPIL
jgi:hypothetical protein